MASEHQSPKLKVGVRFPPILPHPTCAEEIPDEYIREHFVLDEYRKKDTVLVEYASLMSEIARYLSNTHGLVLNNNSVETESINIPTDVLVEAIRQVLPTTAGSKLYKGVKLLRYKEVLTLKISARKEDYLDGFDLVLYRERKNREPDAKVIARLKNMVFPHLPKPPVKTAKKKKLK